VSHALPIASPVLVAVGSLLLFCPNIFAIDAVAAVAIERARKLT
jgi:hypothetical protein